MTAAARALLYRLRVAFDLAASIIAVAIGLFVFGAAAWWLVLTAEPPIRSLEGDHALTPKVEPGGELLVARNYCIDKPPVCVVGRRIVNAKEQMLPSVDAPVKLGCFHDQVHSVEIPGFTEYGQHIYRETIRCTVNPAVTRVIALPDIYFEVGDMVPAARKPRR